MYIHIHLGSLLLLLLKKGKLIYGRGERKSIKNFKKPIFLIKFKNLVNSHIIVAPIGFIKLLLILFEFGFSIILIIIYSNKF